MARRAPDPALAQRIGCRIREVREAAGITQQEMADRLCIAAATMSRFESGAITPKTATLVAMGKALGVSPSVFLESKELAGVPDGDEASLLDQYRKLAPQYRRVVRSLISAMLGLE